MLRTPIRQILIFPAVIAMHSGDVRASESAHRVSTATRAWRTRIFSIVALPLFRNGYALLLSGGITSALGIGYWALAARLYPPAVVGRNSALLSAMYLASAVSQLGLTSVLSRFLPEVGTRSGGLIVGSYALNVAASVFFSVVYLAGLRLWSPGLAFLQGDTNWMLAFVIATAAWGIFNLQDSVLTGLRQAIWVPIENAVFAVVKIMLLVALSEGFRESGVFLSWVIPVCLSLLPVNWLIFARLLPGHVLDAPPISNPIGRSTLARFIVANQLGTLCAVAYGNVIPILVVNRVGDSANAFFYLPWLVSTSLQIVAVTMTSSLTVEGARDQRMLGQYCRNVLVHSARLLVPAVALLVVLAPYVLSLFGGEYASQGSRLLQWLSLAALPNLLTTVALGVARVRNRPGTVIVLQALVGLLAPPLVYWLLPSFGIESVGWAWLVSQVAVALYAVLVVIRPLYTPKTSSIG